MEVIFSLGKMLFGRLSFCSLSGGIIGAVTGGLFGLLQLGHAGSALATPEIIQIGFLLALLGWLIVLVVVGGWRHYGLGTIALPSLINALLTSVLTVYVNNLIQLPILATLIGLLVGILVGSILCRLCQKRGIRDRNLQHG